MTHLRTLIDRHDTTKIKALDRMVAELSSHMNEVEIDRAVDLLNTLSSSKWDVNLSVDDAASQLKILLGSDRYEEIKAKWSLANQPLIKEGRTKYIHKESGAIYDGLDPTDDPNDYTKVQM